MARQARIKNIYGIYHIFQQGGAERSLFTGEEDREKWLRIVAKAKEKYQFKVYAYCASQPNEYHLVLNLQGGDISKIMKSINIAYAMHIKCPKQLFRDRYRSRLIETKNELLELMAEIHRRANHSDKKPNPYNSFCCYRGLTKDLLVPLDINDIRTKEDVTKTTPTSKNQCDHCIQSLEEAEKKLVNLLKVNSLTIQELVNDKRYRNQLIRTFRQESTLSLKELGVLFGGLSESAISKIISRYESGG
jgi:putative transposase